MPPANETNLLGLGGAFLYARDPLTLATWYDGVLGIPYDVWGDSVFSGFPTADLGAPRPGPAPHLIWALLAADADHPPGSLRLNWRVRDLDAALAGREDRVTRRFQDENGRFAWVSDPEGNTAELIEANPIAAPEHAMAERPWRVQGVGGAFLFADDPAGLADWYSALFGVTIERWGEARGRELPGRDREPGPRIATTTWSLLPRDAQRPEPPLAGYVNYRVPDLDAVIAGLEAAGERVEPLADEEYGRFAWTWDPEGNRIELWQPPLRSAEDPVG